MLGIGLAIAGIGIAAFVRTFRRTRAGVRLTKSLSDLRLAEVVSLVIVSLILYSLVSFMVIAWVGWQIQNAQILAGVA